MPRQIPQPPRSRWRPQHLQRLLLPRALALLALLGACGPQLGAQPEARPALPEYNLPRARLAIDGYDPVAYFPEGGATPQPGDPTVTATYEGVVYQFASPEHRERFLASPRRYEPAYGGWCAYAMAKGNKIRVDPEAFLIQDDRLLLFYRTALSDTRDRWAERPDDLLIDADVKWRDWTGECPHRCSASGASKSPGAGDPPATPSEEASQ